ncbi:carboxypeptidase-like regulatory domain-containing protein [Halobacteriaceae archaeon GCM10025711]
MQARTLVLALLLVLAAGVPSAAAQDKVTLTVTVVDQSDDPVADATLDVSWDGGSATETTRSNGQALVDVPAGANVTIAVNHEDYVKNFAVYVADAEAQKVKIDVFRKARLQVDVTNDPGPLAGAQVTVSKNGDVVREGQTDANGGYNTGVVEQGEYDVEVVKPGYYRETFETDVVNNTTEAVSLEQGSVLLTFVVTDDHYDPNQTVGGVTLDIEQAGSPKTLDDGRATARVPVNTVLTMDAKKDGYETTTRDIYVGESDARINVSIDRTPSINLSVLSSRVVAGERLAVEVTDEYDEPVNGAAVLLDGTEVATTNDDGEATVTIEDPGDHQLKATSGDLETDPVSVEAITGSGDTTTQATDTTTPATTTSTGLPGFTVPIALLAFALGIALGVRRLD